MRGRLGASIMLAMLAGSLPTEPVRAHEPPVPMGPPVSPEQRRAGSGRGSMPPDEANPNGRAARRRKHREEKKRR